MNNRKFYMLIWPYSLWQNFLRMECFLSLKNSSKDNMTEGIFYHSPLVGYSFLSSANNTSSTRSMLGSEKREGSCNSSEITASTVAFIHEHPFGRQKHPGYFSSWLCLNEFGFYGLQLPVEKLLFDILKNLVTFTASNHCMYGGKRYN